MNKILTLLAVSAIAFSASAETAVIPWPQGAVTDITVDRSASTLIVNMNIHPDSFPKKSNREVWLRPAVVAETDTLFLDPVLISGRTRYYQHLRLDRDDNTTIMLRAGSDEVYAYQTLVPYLGQRFCGRCTGGHRIRHGRPYRQTGPDRDAEDHHPAGAGRPSDASVRGRFYG